MRNYTPWRMWCITVHQFSKVSAATTHRLAPLFSGWVTTCAGCLIRPKSIICPCLTTKPHWPALGYLRPVAYRGLGGLGITAQCPTDVAVAALAWGAYLGEEALEKGIDACVSSWQRLAPNTIPAGAKAGGNYLSGALIASEARRLGFGEGIALSTNGLLSEGAGENLFLVFNGALHTTPASASILNGITRNTLMTLAREDGIEVVERDMPREYLYLADEVFMCGTAAEVTPIRSVDARLVGEGKPGPITGRMQELFFGLFKGKEDTRGWLTHF